MGEEKIVEYGIGLCFNGTYIGLITAVDTKIAGETSVEETNRHISGTSLRAVLYQREVVRGHWVEAREESRAESGVEKKAEEMGRESQSASSMVEQKRMRMSL